MADNLLDLVIFENGATSVRDTSTGEAMHSSIGPWEEAQKVYLAQSGFEEALKKPISAPLVIYDLGLGIATNALAVLHRYRELIGSQESNLRPVRMISFENNLDGLRLALKNEDQFPFLPPYSELLERFLQDRGWKENGARFDWTLVEGDFKEINLHALPSPEIVFYDFYSPKSAPWLWGTRSFERLMTLRQEEVPMRLITYSAATPVRAAMLLAGFHVGLGRATGHKMETTVASTDLQALERPLDEQWIAHYHRSSKRLPLDFQGSEAEAQALIQSVLNAPQFRNQAGS